MKITSFGHCCLLIEEDGAHILTDPGSFSAGYADLSGLDALVITHEHMDHLDIEGVRSLIAKNPQLRVITNNGVGGKFKAEGIDFTAVEDGQSIDINGVMLTGVGARHALMHETMPVVANTGYFLGPRLFYPGDALTIPEKPVEILALPLMAPWMKLGETIDYLLAVKPASAFPVHDALLKNPEGLYGQIIQGYAEKNSTRFEMFGGRPLEF